MDDHDDFLPPGTSNGPYLVRYKEADQPNWHGSAPFSGVYDWDAQFWEDYVGLEFDSNGYLTSEKAIIFCPSGTRKLSDAGSSYNARQNPIDYQMSGAPLGQGDGSNRAGFALVKAGPYWEPLTDNKGQIPFSFDAGLRSGANHPHSGGDASINGVFSTQGMNLMLTDGSGSWLGKDSLRPLGWHPSNSDLKMHPWPYRTIWYVFTDFTKTPTQRWREYNVSGNGLGSNQNAAGQGIVMESVVRAND